MKIAVLCGGPSLERGISLNSARSVCDHLQSETIEIAPVYFDHRRKPYQISRAQLYSNTPSDFDFKLRSHGKPLSAGALARFLKEADLVFPVMHGEFGEDGQIQRLLTRLKCPFVGSPADACKKAFDKYEANEFIRQNGFYALPSVVLKSHLKDHKKILDDFFREHAIARAVVKPATGGSSIGVHSVATPEEALLAARSLFAKRIDTRVVVEPFCRGTEFTVIVLENRFGLPVAIMPTEIEMNYDHHQVFDYRRKYLATNQVTYHCPPRFKDDVMERIQIQAEQLFKLLGMRDFARFDGWLLPDGNLWFSDFNPISGMEQNSFLFQQSARIGMGHRDLLRHILRNACRRYGIVLPKEVERGTEKKEPVSVLFGGKTAERQVSLMTGTNAWLKLRRSKKYAPEPYLLDADGAVWHLPYALTLNHTVEEIMATCRSAGKDEDRLKGLRKRVLDKLSAHPDDLNAPWFLPEKMTLKTFIARGERVFVGLHGGLGEDGTLQRMLAAAKVPHNGSDAAASALCMDKFATGEKLKALRGRGIHVAEKKLEKTAVFRDFSPADYKRYWQRLTVEIGGNTVIVKPRGDGCSAGIARLFSARDLSCYVAHVQKKTPSIPAGTLKGQETIIEMPTETMEEVMFERFIVTDKVRAIESKLKWKTVTEWIEVTMGLVGPKGGMRALSPSITVATGNILTLEEKFQGGTGVNITPPPQPYVRASAVEKAKKRMEEVARVLGLGGYARVDAFLHVKTGELIIIEANTTPALTPSTVLFHQALAEDPPVYPIEFIEKIT